MKRLLALTMTLVLALTCTAVLATAEELTATVTVTVSKSGSLVLAAETVTVTDTDGDGVLTVSDALYAAHEAGFDGGAAAGYEAYVHKDYGLSLGKLWGDTSGNFGYYLDNASAWSLADPVTDGSYVCAFVYADGKFYSDVYTFFDQTAVNTKAGEEITLTLSQAGFDADWNPVILPVSGAVITVNGAPTEIKTDGEGKATIKLTESGQMLISATMEGITAVPPVCKATVKSSVAAGDESLLWLAVMAILAAAGICRMGFARKKLDN